MKQLLVISLLLGLVPAPTFARIWTVNEDGSGDAPNLYAAMDSAATGDSVLVSPGHYALPTGLLVSGVRLIGANGPAETHIEVLANDAFTSGITLRARLEGIHVYGVSNIAIVLLDGGEIDNCVIEVIEGQGGLPHAVTIYGPSSISRSLVANGEINIYSLVEFSYNIIVADLDASAPNCCSFFSNDVFGEISPNITIGTQDLNFFLDPQFCGIPGSGNYYLKSTSPCLSENNPYGVPLAVGPLGLGCGAVSVKSTTWGSIRTMYKDKR